MLLKRSILRTSSLRSSSYLRTIRYGSSLAPPLIRIQDGTFYQNYPTVDDAAKAHNPPLFPNLNFVLPSKPTSSAAGGKESLQHWAVIGSSGRTQLLDVLRGQYICLPPTARSYPYLLTDEIATKDSRLRFVGNAIQYIGFKGEGSEAIGGTRGAYLSARYESLREETDWSVRQFLRGQTSLNPLEGEENGTIRDEQLLEQVITDLHLGELLDMPVANLSNGQTRRARIAKALLSQPQLLLLDEPFMGLDPATVRSISGLLERLANKASPRLILALRPQDNVPDWITHILLLGNFSRVLFQGAKSDAEKTLNVWRQLTNKDAAQKLDEADQKILSKANVDMEAGYLDRQLLWDLNLIERREGKLSAVTTRGGEPLIEMDGVRVQYGDKAVLGNWKQKVENAVRDGLHWTVRRGQRWVVLGANGSGKTTLLSLITSDHPQAYALPIKVLGRSRLPEAGKPGISIFELQSRLGHSSPEIHAFFPRQLSIREAIESAFAETFLAKPTLDHDRDLDVSAALRFFKAELDPDAAHATKPPEVSAKSLAIFPKIGTLNNKGYVPIDYDVEYADSVRFGELSTAQQRLVLFIRALIHKPDIVILDEPFSNMSASLRDKCIHFLEAGETSGKPTTVTRRMSGKDRWLRGSSDKSNSVRHRGLSDEQALIMISHIKEEIPDSVRYYMRLPSEPGDGGEPLDFRFGLLESDSVMSDPKVWDLAWSPPSRFDKDAHLLRRDQSFDEETKQQDEDVYEWYSIAHNLYYGEGVDMLSFLDERISLTDPDSSHPRGNVAPISIPPTLSHPIPRKITQIYEYVFGIGDEEARADPGVVFKAVNEGWQALHPRTMQNPLFQLLFHINQRIFYQQQKAHQAGNLV
ncbi:putative ABC transporter [Aspergillus clavatus NRRL 1]|uniref:ABC transporter, putative n=1 Tax=Aspergillus clavatus (strain ATCC 1007 / CBS 513.65 / DSM 816 / NCTC 3887 / NRRL 1 / QM 1276 / 107) TaxID=344612 RepID=A1CU20_ASPCL|nr:ABC transporter, putative [Aspergillus clavatus NRRL 1]EAW06807.1 ABC transporter, putative [Aspergillus clavatus NRRL 1]